MTIDKNCRICDEAEDPATYQVALIVSGSIERIFPDLAKTFRRFFVVPVGGWNRSFRPFKYVSQLSVFA